MKKLSLLLAVLLLFTCCGSALAEDFDLSFVRSKTSLYEIDVEIEDDIAFIDSTLSASDRSFVHKYESSTRYSTTEFDMLVIQYLKSTAYPVFRLWITYCADNDYLNINAVTFTIGDKKYTFTDIADTDWYVHDEKGYVEQVLIKFDLNNTDFLLALEGLLPETLEEFDGITIPMTLHGREDIQVELGGGFLLDFFVMEQAMIKSNGVGYFEKAHGSPLKITPVTPAQ